VGQVFKRSGVKKYLVKKEGVFSDLNNSVFENLQKSYKQELIRILI